MEIALSLHRSRIRYLIHPALPPHEGKVSMPDIIVNTLVIFNRHARLEEATLAERFGKEWDAYVKRTKFSILFIW